MPRRTLVLLAPLLLAGCLSPEQRMARRVDGWMEAQRYEDALDYLDRFLARHSRSLRGWRYRVLIRLEQSERALAAAEYAALERALDSQQPDVLRDVVLGAGGRWLQTDYRTLARCAPMGIADEAFFADLLEPQELRSGSVSRVAVPDDEVAAILDALPGSLDPAETWRLASSQGGGQAVQAAIVRAAGRHLAAGLADASAAEARARLVAAAGSGDERIRQACLLASFELGEVPAALVDALAAAGDEPRTVAAFLRGEWADGELQAWAEAAGGPLRVLAVASLHQRQPMEHRARFLAGAGPDAASRLAAVHPGSVEDADAVWTTLTLAEQRVWGPVFARSAGANREAWVRRTLGASDALLVQAAADALALPGVGPDPAVDGHLQKALASGDAASRARVARAAVLRGSHNLVLPVQGLLARGDDQVLMAVLEAMAGLGDPAWSPLVETALASDLPLARERAVDALAATCERGDRSALVDLLLDANPYVAIRAASALYLRSGMRQAPARGGGS